MLLTRLLFLTLTLTLVTKSSEAGSATGSKPVSVGSTHLGAFKQLGFDLATDNSQAGSDGRKAAFIPYSISSFNNNNNNNNNRNSAGIGIEIEEAKSEKFQQIKHPNDILTNMGVKLPSEQILGQSKIHSFDTI